MAGYGYKPELVAVDAGATERERIYSMLGRPRRIEPGEIISRRNLLNGLPMSEHQLRSVSSGILRDVLSSMPRINICALVVDDLVAAMNISGVAGLPDDVHDVIWAAWQRSDLAATTEGLFTMSACDGQSFLIVDGDTPETMAAYVNAAYDGHEGVDVLSIGPDGRITCCVKHEVETVYRHSTLTVWQRFGDWVRGLLGKPDPAHQITGERRIKTEYSRYTTKTGEELTRIRHFVSEPDTVERQCYQGDDGEWIVADPNGGDDIYWPYGYPVIPLVAPKGGELVELRTPQELVNTAFLDLATAARIDGLRIMYTVNCEPIMGPDGNALTEVGIKPGVVAQFQSMATSAERAPSVGSIPPSDINALASYAKQCVETMLLIARASLNALSPWKSTIPPSGTALWIASGPYRAKVERYREQWSGDIREVFAVWQRIMGIAEPAYAEPLWADLQFLPPGEVLMAAQIAQAIGLPEDYAAQLVGLSPQLQEQWKASLEADAVAQQQMIDAEEAVAPAVAATETAT